MRFYLGVHRPNWLGQTTTPLFVSRRVLEARRSLPEARGRWVLDSGGFTELNMYGEWRTPIEQYVEEIHRYADGIGGLDWAAPMDWMCEPGVREHTGLSVREHQERTIDNYLALRDQTDLVAPVLQGWEWSDYLDHLAMYEQRGISLHHEPVVGVGSICRRGQDAEIQRVVRSLVLAGLDNLHAFGVRSGALLGLSDVLQSADSMAWSYSARLERPLPGCTHKSCANCLRYAERWHARTMAALGQLRMEIA